MSAGLEAAPNAVPPKVGRAAPAPLPWPPPLGPAFHEELQALFADPTQGERGPRAYAPMKQKRLFESEFAGFCGRRFAVAVNSGTTALDLAVEALELPPGAVAIAANYGHPATIRRAAQTRPLRLVDVEPQSLSMSAKELAAALEPGDAGVVLLTHFAGHGGQLHEIVRLCAAAGVPLIEDASHAHGATFDGRRAGAFGRLGCFSLHATKNLSCGEGGIICLDDEALFRRLWRAHDLGRDLEAGPFEFTDAGGNYRLGEVAALEARHRLRTLEAQLAACNSAAGELLARLGESACLQPVHGNMPGISGWHILAMWYRPEAAGGQSRHRFIMSLNAAGIPCHAGWPVPLNRLPAFAGAEAHPCPVAERACAEQVWLDGRLLLQEDGVERICAALARITAHSR